MIQIPEKTIPAFHSQTILSLNTQKVRTAKSSQTILQLNQNLHSHSPAPTIASYRHPTFKNIVQKANTIPCICTVRFSNTRFPFILPPSMK